MTETPYDDSTYDDTTEATDLGPVIESYDMSGDGVYDVEVARFQDGSYYVVVDGNLDGQGDLLGVDMDGDGMVDTMVKDLGDGRYELHQDLDGDGITDQKTELTRDELAAQSPAVLELLDAQFERVDGVVDPVVYPEPPVDPVDPDPVNWVEEGRLVGDPTGDAEHWFVQAQNGFCVPASVAQIVAEYTGQDFADEEHFVERTNELGLFVYDSEGIPGMTANGALELLESYGVPAELTVGSVDTLAQSLEDGRRVMLFVDSGEIWYGEDVEDNAADHAITVTGIDYERGVVIISDTGDPNGNMNELSIADFEDAWADSGYAMVQCDEPAPQDGGPQVAFEPDLVDTLGATRDDATAGDEVAATQVQPQVQSMTDWVTDHPWVLIPVVLGAGTLIAKV